MVAKRLLAGLAAVVAGILAFATPAYADDYEVRLSAEKSIHVGGQWETTKLTVENNTDRGVGPTNRRFTFALSGLRADQVRFARHVNDQWMLLPVAGETGNLHAADRVDQLIKPKDKLETEYAIQLVAGAPNGRLRLSAAVTSAFTGRSLGNDSITLRVQGGAQAAPSASDTPSPTPSATAEPTDTAAIPTDDATGDSTGASTGENTGSGLPWFAYGIGILLVLGGAGLFTYLWFNRETEPEPVEEYDPTLIRRGPPRVYGATGSAPPDAYERYLHGPPGLAPTAQLPAIPPPPGDPTDAPPYR